MSNSEINDPRLAGIEDARLLGMLFASTLESGESFDDFKDILTSSINEANSLVNEARAYSTVEGKGNGPVELPKDMDLRPCFEACQDIYRTREEEIVRIAKGMVGGKNGRLSDAEIKANDDAVEKEKKIEPNEMGKAIAEGPDLMIVDGGPGSGKTFSMQKAMDIMKTDPVICLGSTETAAADLYKEIGEEKDKKNVKHTILGGLTIDQLLPEDKELKDPELQKRKTELLNTLKSIKESKDPKKSKPCIMVDEAGLLDHRQMADLMKFMEKYGGKLVLAGDAQQIPPNEGQPFKMLAESLKDTPAYINSAYITRQGSFAEKAITAGIYRGKNSSEEKIDQEVSAEFLKGAFAITGGPIKPLGNGMGLSFQDHLEAMESTGKFGSMEVTVDKTKSLEEQKAERLAKKYTMYLAQNQKNLLPKDENGNTNIKSIVESYERDFKAWKKRNDSITAINEAVKNGKLGKEFEIPADEPKRTEAIKKFNEALKDEGFKKELEGKEIKDLDGNEIALKPEKLEDGRYDQYMCAVLVLQQQGIQAYETIGKLKSASRDDSALFNDVAQSFKNDEYKPQTDEKAAGKAFKGGHLAITATVDEANRLNDAIREARGLKGKGLQAGEPILLEDGTKRLATQKDAENGLPEGARYAYALDVKATQGLSQDGLVTMVVTQENAAKWHGGEILVGASRHKKNFELKMSGGVDKEKFFDASTHQYASKRIIGSAFNEELYTAALGKADKADKKSLMGKIEQKMEEAKKERDTADRQQKEDRQPSLNAQIKAHGNNRNLTQEAINKAKANVR